MKMSTALRVAGIVLATATLGQAANVRGWLSWRGPQQNGSSFENKSPR